jgi:PAS domain S-box-containing protein
MRTLPGKSSFIRFAAPQFVFVGAVIIALLLTIIILSTFQEYQLNARILDKVEHSLILLDRDTWQLISALQDDTANTNIETELTTLSTQLESLPQVATQNSLKALGLSQLIEELDLAWATLRASSDWTLALSDRTVRAHLIQQLIKWELLLNEALERIEQIHVSRLSTQTDRQLPIPITLLFIALVILLVFNSYLFFRELQIENRSVSRAFTLERERAQLKAILDGIGEGVIYTENSKFIYMNQALTRMTGFSADDAEVYPALLHSETLSDSELVSLQQKIYEMVLKKGIWQGQAKIRRKNGEEFDAALISTRVSEKSNGGIGIITLIRDISQEKALQEQKSRFVSIASHELRTPLTNLKMSLYLLRHQPEKMQKHIETVEYVANRMKNMVEDLLDVSRFESGIISLEPDNFVLQDVINQVVKAQSNEAAHKHVTLNLELPGTPIEIYADDGRIGQMMNNLLGNAINYTLENGQVIVHVLQEPNCVRIDVQDSGIGIPEEMLPQIFEPFFRASEGLIRGTGVGLTIVKEIVELHGGTITVRSTLGKGSTFTVRLPIHASNVKTS